MLASGGIRDGRDLLAQVAVFGILDHANHLIGRFRITRFGPGSHGCSDGIGVTEKLSEESFVDQGHLRRSGRVVFVEIPP